MCAPQVIPTVRRTVGFTVRAHDWWPMTLAILGILLLAPQSPDAAESERAPSFSDLPSVRYESAISMECDGVPPFDRVLCRFRMVHVEKPEAQELPQYRGFAEKHYRERFDEAYCASIRGWTSPDDRLPGVSAAKVAWFERRQSARLAVCACLDRPCLTSKIRDLVTAEMGGCTVRTNSFSVELARVPGQRTWISAPTSWPICGLEETHEVEQVGARGWRYTMTLRVEGELPPECEAWDEQLSHPSVFSSDTPGTSLLDCAYVHFGPHWTGIAKGGESAEMPSNEAMHQTGR